MVACGMGSRKGRRATICPCSTIAECFETLSLPTLDPPCALSCLPIALTGTPRVAACAICHYHNAQGYHPQQFHHSSYSKDMCLKKRQQPLLKCFTLSSLRYAFPVTAFWSPRRAKSVEVGSVNFWALLVKS